MTDVPGRYFVSLAGTSYVVDHKDRKMARQSIAMQRPFQDVSSKVGEHSLTSDDLWRRSFESWHRGAGQSSFDRPDGDEFRFDSSLGVDPWTKWRLSLLGDTDRKLASTATVCKLAVAGTYLYAIDGQVLKYTSSVTAAGVASWTTVTGTPAVAATGITSDGATVWVAYGSSGVYATRRGTAVASLYTDVTASAIDYVKGRLMVASGNDVYNITTSATNAGIVFRGVTTDNSNTPVTSKTISYPSGAQPGDLIVVYVEVVTEVGPTLPAAFTLMDTAIVGGGTQYGFLAYYREMPGDGSTSFTVTIGTAQRMLVTCLAYSSADPVPLYHSNSQVAAAADHPTATGATYVETTNPLVLFAIGTAGGSVTSTPPSAPYGSGSMNERADIATSTAAISLAAYDSVIVGAATDTPNIVGTISSAAFTSNVHLSIWAPRTPPAVLYAQPTGDFTWVGFADGQGDIYASGYSGQASLIYKTQIRDDATSLDQPSVAGALPDGEIVRSIYGYLGFVFIGTDKGVRMAASDANGNLTIGSLIPTPAPVRCFEGQDRFVWFGLEDFDVSAWASGTYDGLGRLDLREATSPLTPAYASDLMVTASTGTTEQVQSIATFQNLRIFTVADSGGASRGVYAETAIKVAAGYLDSGLVTYGISDVKVATYLDVRHRPLVGSIQAYVAADEGAFASVGTSSTASTTTPAAMAVGSVRGETHEVRVKLARSSVSDTVGPTLTRLTLRSEPAPTRGRLFQVPLVIDDHIVTPAGQQIGRDPGADLAAIEALFASQTLVPYVEGANTYNVFIKDYTFIASQMSANRRSNIGTCLVTLKVPGA